MNETGHGLLIIDKPGGITSRDAVDRAQGWFPRRTRLGHTGTLDPLATGVLVLAVGSATRLTEYVQRMAKTYRAEIILGARSDSDDADGTITAVAGVEAPDLSVVRSCLDGFVGVIEQVPPAYSAAKVRGRRAYDMARRGEEVDLAPRPVRVDRIDVTAYDYPRLVLEVLCGKGTYIRSLARDLGERLGCGGYIGALRRTRVGPFEASAGVSLDASTAIVRAALLPLALAVSDLTRVALDQVDLTRLCQGRVVGVPAAAGLLAESEVAVFDEAGRLRLVATVSPDGLQPTKVFPLVDPSP